MGHFQGMRRLMGGFVMDPQSFAPDPQIEHALAKERQRQHAETARLDFNLGRLIRRMEMVMRTLEEVLDVVTAQRTKIDSLAALTSGIKRQLDEALAGALTPSQQMRVDAIFNRLGENTAAVADAIDANDGDPNTPPLDMALTRTTVASSNNRTNVGDPVTFSAGVERDPTASADKVLSGSVAFMVDGTEAGSATIGADGVGVSAPITSLTAGEHSVTATYSGNKDFASSSSEAIMQAVAAMGSGVGQNPNPPPQQLQPQQQPLVDPASGQPASQTSVIDPATGRPFVAGQSRTAQGRAIDPATGQQFLDQRSLNQQNQQPQIDPATGRPVAPNPIT